MTAKAPIRRCAVYTRKSSEEGLEQDFNSLHAQREACEAFIRSQRDEGWRLIETAYDDGGLCGGTLDRPALQHLLADITQRRVDTVVVYKVDRLTRSLMDFAKIVELFDRHGVTFVAITQQFNTTTSMGRLTLNILLSFAQFEREVIGERVRDKIAASKKKGMWMGGIAPLGYEVIDRKLTVFPEEAATVRLIFRRYLGLGSVRLLKQELEQTGIRSKQRVRRDGSRTGGQPFSRARSTPCCQTRSISARSRTKRRAMPGSMRRSLIGRSGTRCRNAFAVALRSAPEHLLAATVRCLASSLTRRVFGSLPITRQKERGAIATMSRASW